MLKSSASPDISLVSQQQTAVHSASKDENFSTTDVGFHFKHTSHGKSSDETSSFKAVSVEKAVAAGLVAAGFYAVSRMLDKNKDAKNEECCELVAKVHRQAVQRLEEEKGKTYAELVVSLTQPEAERLLKEKKNQIKAEMNAKKGGCTLM